MKNKKSAWVADIKKERELKDKSDADSTNKTNADIVDKVKVFFTQNKSSSTTGSSLFSDSNSITFDHMKGLLAKLT